MEKLKSGVPGFDDICGGGLVRNTVILLSGGCGTGKSTFALQFLIEGARNGENGLYLSLEDSQERIIENNAQFDWKLDKLIQDKKIIIQSSDIYDFDKLKTMIENLMEEYKAKRFVLDSTTILGLFFDNRYQLRKGMIDLNKMVKKLDCTPMFISEIPEDSKLLSTYGIEEFVADGVVVLYSIKKRDVYRRGITIRKMRGTNHSQKVHPMQITNTGILVFPSEELFGVSP